MNNQFELSRLTKALIIACGVSVLPVSAHAEVVGSQTGSEIILADNTTVIGDKTASALYGILVPFITTGKVDVGTGSAVNVANANAAAQGIVLLGPDSTLHADKLSVNVSGKAATGIDILGKNNSATLGSGTSVTTVSTDGHAYGITVGNASSLRADALKISTQGTGGTGLLITWYGSHADIGDGGIIETSGATSHGVQVDALGGDENNGVASVVANGLKVTTLGNGANAINVQANSTADLGSHSILIVNGTNSSGIFSLGNLTADHLAISTAESGSVGVEVRGNGVVNIGAGSTVVTNRSGALVAMDNGATLNFLGSEDERNTLKSSGIYAASAQSTGATVNLQHTDISLNTVNGAALWSLLGGVINGDALTITSSTGNYGVLARSGGQVNLTNDVTIDMGSPEQLAIGTQYIEGYAPGVVTADATMKITGSMKANGGLIDLKFAPDSLWYGSAASDNIDDGHLNISLTDSAWRVAASSVLDNLELNNSLVDLSAATDTTAYSTLTIANLSGSGDFTLRTNVAGDGNGANNTGDKIVVKGSSAGAYGLNIQNQGSAATNGDEVLTIVETSDGIATFTGNNDVELGGYVYTVNKHGNDWVLSSPKSENSENNSEIVGDSGVVKPAEKLEVTPVITTTANAGANFLNVGYLITYAETQTLLQRMGDVRQGKTAGNVWLRGVDGRFNGFASGKLSNFSMDYSGYQFGVDKRLAEEIPVYLGLFMGVTEGSPNYQSGSGKTKSEHFGFYGTWINDAGFYIDGVMKFNRLRHQFSVNDTQSNRVSGSSVSSGLSASLEVGKRFSFSESREGVYLEPQLQLTAGHQNGSRIRASNGLDINLSNYKTFQGRASVLAGYEINQAGYKLNAYIKTGAIREYAGDTAYSLNRSHEKFTFQGNSWNNGVGLSAQLQDHTLFIEADMTDGSRFNQRQFNAGYRFSF